MCRFGSIGTDLDQCKSSLTILAWLIKQYPMKGYRCYGFDAVMSDPDRFLEEIGHEKGMYKKEAKQYLGKSL